MKTLILMMIAVSGDNVNHLNSGGFQLSIAPMRYESMADCNKEKSIVARRVMAWVKQYEHDEDRLRGGKLSVKAECEELDRETGDRL